MLPLQPQSVSLPRRLPHERLDYGQLRQEPAITGFDWLFTPTPKLRERLSAAPLRASTKYYFRFTLLRSRSTGFGYGPCDCRHFHTSPLVNCGLIAFAMEHPYRVLLATRTNSRARYSKRTMHVPLRRATNLYLLGFKIFSLPVTGPFQLSLTVLVRYRTRRIFRVSS